MLLEGTLSGFGLWTELYATVGHVLTGVLILLILNAREESQSPLGWILAVLVAPYLAGLAYLVFGGYRVRAMARYRANSDLRYMHELPEERGGLPEPLPGERLSSTPQRAAELDYPFTRGNEVEVLTHGEDKYARLEADILGARSHIHLAYYVWSSDATGAWLRDLLVAKAEEGVEVRVLYDAWGALGAGRFLRPLRAAGGDVRAFASLISPASALSANLRNHRKIAVIDGTRAYTGGINIGNDYRGREGPKQWRDMHLRVAGPVVTQIATVFAKDWYFTCGDLLTDPAYFPDPPRDGASTARALPSGPGQYWRSFHETVFNAVACARERIDVVTPYYVPDRTMQVALAAAARRGVRVRMLVPGQNNHPLVAAASSSFYGELMEAGVTVYRSREGMVHGKYLTVDGQWGTVGSANLDSRSFYLNYELNVILRDPEAIATLSSVFETEMETAVALDLESYRARPAWRNSLEGLARTLSPML